MTSTDFYIVYSGSTRGHFVKLYCPELRNNIQAHIFGVRVIYVWNK